VPGIKPTGLPHVFELKQAEMLTTGASLPEGCRPAAMGIVLGAKPVHLGNRRHFRAGEITAWI
jgi:hypothetical protein